MPLYLYLLYYLLPSLSVLGKRGLGGHRRGVTPSSGARGSSARGRMYNVNLKHFVFGAIYQGRAIFPHVYYFLLRESVHTVGIEGRMVGVDVMSVCVLKTLSTSTESASIK